MNMIAKILLPVLTVASLGACAVPSENYGHSNRYDLGRYDSGRYDSRDWRNQRYSPDQSRYQLTLSNRQGEWKGNMDKQSGTVTIYMNGENFTGNALNNPFTAKGMRSGQVLTCSYNERRGEGNCNLHGSQYRLYLD